MASAAIAAAASAAICLAASPYLARLTLTVPDRDDHHWWRGRAADSRRRSWTAVTAVVIGALAGAAAGWGALLPAFVALAVAGTTLVVIDVEHHRLPDRLVAPTAIAAAALLALAAAIRHDWTDYLRSVEGAASVFAVLFLLAFISPRSFGFGDVKLGGILGGYLGWTGWLAVYYGIFAGFVLGALFAIGLLLSRRASMKSALAFGPMLLFGALIVLAVAGRSGSLALA